MTNSEFASISPLAYDARGIGPTLVLLHAFPLDRTMWTGQLKGLSSDCHVIVPDAFGFGGTPLPSEGWTIDGLADSVALLLDSIDQTEPVILGGLSMGGYVALAFARRHPQRLRGLILADTRAEPDSAEAKAGRAAMIELGLKSGSSAVIEKMLPNMLSPVSFAERPEVVATVRRIVSTQKPESIAAALGALRDRPDARPGLSTIKVPTLIIVGEDDKITPPDAARTLNSAISQSKLVIISGAGHLSHLEAPEAFNAAIREFVNSL